MYYFKNKISLKLLQKEKEIDNDVLEGKIELVLPDDICLLLDHKKTSNNFIVKIIKETTVKEGFNHLNPYPISQDDFQCLILKSDFNIYMKDYNFIQTKSTSTVTNFEYSPKLVRESEPTIKNHRYF